MRFAFRLAERLGKTLHELMTGRSGQPLTAVEEAHWRAYWKVEYGKEEDEVIDNAEALMAELGARLEVAGG